jgi:hypothetical protein
MPQMSKLILIGCSWILLLTHSFASPNSNLTGSWISKGQSESRSLTLDPDGKGEFLSMHSRGNCSAQLQTEVDETFFIASGIANHCQQRNNAVAFEFYCQQTSADQLRCKIRSAHIQSGNTKEGIENFTRK